MAEQGEHDVELNKFIFKDDKGTMQLHSWIIGKKDEVDSITTGKVTSWRHNAFVKGPPSRRAQLKKQLWNIRLNRWAVEEIPLQLLKIYCGKDMKMFTYVYDVLVPEVVIRLLMELHSIGYSEIIALTKFRHPNLVGLMGFHNTSDKLALVYEYLEEGSLYSHLHDYSKSALSWDNRSNVLRCTCRALTYLHGGNPPLIHQDIKSLNILLDINFVPKLGDFGFAMDLPAHHSGRTLVSAPLVARSDGYFAPELIGRKISPKSDVYSFGVVVLETFTGKKAYDKDRPDPELALHCQDALDDLGTATFNNFCDDRISKPDLNLSTLLYNVARRATKRHSIRSTSAELLELFEEYSDE